MTKLYAARKLLEHGALFLCEFQEITGWNYHSCRKVLARLRDEGWIRSVRLRRSDAYGTLYELV